MSRNTKTRPQFPKEMLDDFDRHFKALKSGSAYVDAFDAAFGEVGRSWGLTKADGDERWMRKAPELCYGTDCGPEQDGTWMGLQLRRDLRRAGLIKPGERVRLELDPTDDAERPLYGLSRIGATGTAEPILGADGRALRWRPDAARFKREAKAAMANAANADVESADATNRGDVPESPIPLNIEAQLHDLDGSETLSMTQVAAPLAPVIAEIIGPAKGRVGAVIGAGYFADDIVDTLDWVDRTFFGGAIRAHGERNKGDRRAKEESAHQQKELEDAVGKGYSLGISSSGATAAQLDSAAHADKALGWGTTEAVTVGGLSSSARRKQKLMRSVRSRRPTAMLLASDAAGPGRTVKAPIRVTSSRTIFQPRSRQAPHE